ncbi:hypothetical protein GGU11DRAFT_823674 [Lentinula aff. detonsa]|nr:hypothetical protein GGU11DRAFT_823674 [Lentinula aff. detonsa]
MSIGDLRSPNAQIPMVPHTPIPQLILPLNPLHPLRTLTSQPTSTIMIQGPLPHNSITTPLPTISRLAPCKPQKGRSIKSNHLRLSQRGDDGGTAEQKLKRKRTDTDPNDKQREALSTQLPGHVIDNAFNIAGEGLSNSTKANYTAGLLQFNQFCNKENIPEEARMPASEILLAGFVGASAGSVSGRTIRAWLSGLRA